MTKQKAGSPMQHYSIGAVARLTDIPAHTLRKWESRHGIATPLRSPTGRRVYTDDHVVTLKLIKHLMASGHALGHLAELGSASLRELADQHLEPERPAVTSITLVGPNLSRLLPNQRIVSGRFDGDLQEWLAQSPDGLVVGEPVAVETETLPEHLVGELLVLRTQVEQLLVVYTFASSHTLAALKNADIGTARGPVDDHELLLHLAPKVADPAPRSAQQQRFSKRELARIAALNPALRCECPNHIAKLLMDIASFEKYSVECVTTDPKEKALHIQLGEISAQARILFEDALIAVASADEIQLAVRR